MKAEKVKSKIVPRNDNVRCNDVQEASTKYDFHDSAATDVDEEQDWAVTRYRVPARSRPQRQVAKAADSSEDSLRREQIARIVALRGRRPAFIDDRGIVAFLADLWFLGEV